MVNGPVLLKCKGMIMMRMRRRIRMVMMMKTGRNRKKGLVSCPNEQCVFLMIIFV